MTQERHGIWPKVHAADLRTELRQLEEEGRNVRAVRARFTRLAKLGDEKLARPAYQIRANALLDEAQALPMRRDYAFDEPSDLPGIRKRRPRGPRKFRNRLSDKALRDRLHGAWVGRCCGCLLGKPVETARTDALWPFLKQTRQWPLAGYLRVPSGYKNRKFRYAESIGRMQKIRYMPVDDDTNYTVIGLLITEQHGRTFAPEDVGRFWLSHVPGWATCTAERVTYRNLMLQMQPPATATFRNPYREWIGAQIRADAFGYVNVGNPMRAAEFAWRDAGISHIKNGIYGEMFMAATLAAAPFCDGMETLLRVGLSEIPGTSRLSADVRTAIDWYRSGLSYDEAVAKIHARWNEHEDHDWCHTNSNAVICTVALLYGEGDFGRAVCRAVQPGFDTDCNGATVGSIMGMRLGASKIPASWSRKVNNTLHTSLIGNSVVKLDNMARRTQRVWKCVASSRSAASGGHR